MWYCRKNKKGKKNEWSKSFSLPAVLFSYVRVCVCMTSLWTPKWKIHSPQERLYNMWRLMCVAGHMSNDVNSNPGSDSHYYHLHHEMTWSLIWSLNKLLQKTQSTLPCSGLAWDNLNTEISETVSLNGSSKRKWSPCYSSISYVQDMVDVLPSSMWYLMWWASTSLPSVVPEATEHRKMHECAPPAEVLKASPWHSL